jgi:hypothetical protein
VAVVREGAHFEFLYGTFVVRRARRVFKSVFVCEFRMCV